MDFTVIWHSVLDSQFLSLAGSRKLLSSATAWESKRGWMLAAMPATKRWIWRISLHSTRLTPPPPPSLGKTPLCHTRRASPAGFFEWMKRLSCYRNWRHFYFRYIILCDFKYRLQPFIYIYLYRNLFKPAAMEKWHENVLEILRIPKFTV